MRDKKTPTRPLPFVASSDAGNAAPPIESLVDALLVKAHRAGAAFVTVEQALVRFLIASGTWSESCRRSSVRRWSAGSA